MFEGLVMNSCYLITVRSRSITAVLIINSSDCFTGKTTIDLSVFDTSRARIQPGR